MLAKFRSSLPERAPMYDKRLGCEGAAEVEWDRWGPRGAARFSAASEGDGVGLWRPPPKLSITFFMEVLRGCMSRLGAVVILFSRRKNSGLNMYSSFGVSPRRFPFRTPRTKSSSICFSFLFRASSTLGSTIFLVVVTFLCALRSTSTGSTSPSALGPVEETRRIQECSRPCSGVTRFLGSCSRMRLRKSTASLLSLTLVCHRIDSVRILTMISRGCWAS
mmetsp:Transcript_72795/g.204429  ORF Transcript_72795/g.204429 Transcript_72795/m.204429 type:complete len:220 (-) Transcript_72795:855-1514(-)